MSYGLERIEIMLCFYDRLVTPDFACRSVCVDVLHSPLSIEQRAHDDLDDN